VALHDDLANVYGIKRRVDGVTMNLEVLVFHAFRATDGGEALVPEQSVHDPVGVLRVEKTKE
jgi:hypothetical protein